MKQRKNARTYDPALIERVRYMRKMGVLVKDIEKICNVNSTKIAEWTKDLYTPKPKFKYPLDLCEKVAKQYEEGKSTKEITEIFQFPNRYIAKNAIKKWYKYINGEMETSRKIKKIFPYVLNHPYALELHPDERSRYYDVVLRRLKKNPECGYDYLERAR